MPVLTLVFRDDGPLPALNRLLEGLLHKLYSLQLHRWPVYQRNHGGIAAPVQDLVQPSLQGTELPTLRIGIHHQRGAIRIHNGFEILRIFSRHHQHHVHVGSEEQDGR